MQIQQGDVIMRSVELIPSGCTVVKKQNGNIVLRHGENGHVHQILNVSDVDAMFLEKDGKFYLKNEKPVVAQHEEHGPITIPAGTWEIGQVREKDWLTGMIAPVVD